MARDIVLRLSVRSTWALYLVGLLALARVPWLAGALLARCTHVERIA